MNKSAMNAIKKVLIEQHLTYDEAQRVLNDVKWSLSDESGKRLVSLDTDR
jgi:DNA polymerase III sliding clamp (beta) subunit (PCNA family)